MLFSPDRGTLARRSLDWATRLVGGDGGVVVDAGGEVLARTGVGGQHLEDLTSHLSAGAAGVFRLGSDDRVAIAVPLVTADGSGGLGVVSGPFTPLFGTDEVQRLEQYSAAFLTALDRVRLVEALQASERRVSELNRDLERRVAERTAQLEATNKELEAFSYTVSHDLRAPLRAIEGFARILVDEHRQQLDSEGLAYLSQVTHSAEDMGKLIDSLLTFSQLTRQPLEAELVEPKALVQRAVNQVKSGLSNRNVEFDIHDLPPVRSDPVLLGQVYANLIGNAVKFTRPVPAARVEIGCDRDGERPVFFVRDNGIGFDMRYAAKLFGVFQRLHRVEDFEGTGAGLAIVQRIVHRHGGAIWAESAPGRGASFYFTLGGGATVDSARKPLAESA
jgi:signal transduction histidine kinase